MQLKNTFNTIKRLHQRLNGNTIQYDLSEYLPIVNDINKLSNNLKTCSDNQVKELSNNLIQRSKALSNINITNLLIEAYALVKEAAYRVLKISPFNVQLIGGIVLHQGKIAELQTGEGKTLSAVFPAYLNALSGKGVHILTFNDYLAKRDAEWMGPIFEFLGQSIGYIAEGMDLRMRQQAYNANVTYVTARESGFDFLRDSICQETETMVHRPFNYAIIDEADSILIDEARIPLVLAGNSETIDHGLELRAKAQAIMAALVRKLQEKIDFDFDEYRRNIHLTDHGLENVENFLKCGNLYDPENVELLARLNFALHAQYLLHRDKNYIVRNSRVELVDEFTGRIADKKQWPEGLQAAVEAKENLSMKSNGVILNSIALQHFIRLYPKLCGMTGTASPAHEEFREFYGLHIVVVPTNKPCIRKDLGSAVYATKKDKIDGIIKEIITEHSEKRPVLVGTESVKDSAELAEILSYKGIPCTVLNAKNDENEAKVIARAGTTGAITISTNMAGRGTDIKLGADSEDEKKRIIALGGLYVMGAAKYESLRIDDQLRGRAARQGDPGACRFFISLDDDLFVKYRLNDLLHLGRKSFHGPRAHGLGSGGQGVIRDPFVNKEIDRVQRIIEGQNFEIKKTLWNYTFLIEQQRNILFQQRESFLRGDHALRYFKTHLPEDFAVIEKKLAKEKLSALCRSISLRCIDRHWSDYLAEVTDIREGIHLRRIGGQNPLFEFQRIIIDLFEKRQKDIESSILQSIHALTIGSQKEGSVICPESPTKSPSSTWTYMINDNPFDPMLEIQLSGNTGVSAWAAMLWPLMALYFIMKKMKRGNTEKD
jgi:preprotein translocase subunit SecA